MRILVVGDSVNHMDKLQSYKMRSELVGNECSIFSGLGSTPPITEFDRVYCDCSVMLKDIPIIQGIVWASIEKDIDVEFSSSETCPFCGSEESEIMSPRTVYFCGTSSYDGRPGTFRPTCVHKSMEVQR